MNRKFYLVAILCATSLLGACAGPGFKWGDAGKIKPGMSTTEVTQLMGEPNTISSHDGLLFYTWASGRMCKNSRAVTVDFKDNKVTDAPAVPTSFKD